MFYVLQLLKLLSVGGASEDFVAQEEEDNVEENAIGFAMILPDLILGFMQAIDFVILTLCD